MHLKAIIDGASRGNPGPAAIGIVLMDDHGKEIQRFSKFLGKTTNNVAEYEALKHCIQLVRRLGGTSVTIWSDSELLVKQFLGQYRIKNERLRKLAVEIRRQIEEGKLDVTVQHVPRTETREADRLANEALNLADVSSLKK